MNIKFIEHINKINKNIFIAKHILNSVFIDYNSTYDVNILNEIYEYIYPLEWIEFVKVITDNNEDYIISYHTNYDMCVKNLYRYLLENTQFIDLFIYEFYDFIYHYIINTLLRPLHVDVETVELHFHKMTNRCYNSVYRYEAYLSPYILNYDFIDKSKMVNKIIFLSFLLHGNIIINVQLREKVIKIITRHIIKNFSIDYGQM